jgi:lipopolysaccharide/colanic/teichoic acid biosynthesis glycosyltransferase
VCVALAQGGRARAELRDRVVLVADPSEAVALRYELTAEPERPAVLLNHLSPEEARLEGRSRPLTELAVSVGATVIVLDRAALAELTVVAQAASLHEAGLRVRPLSAFYEEWLGKLPLSELERASLLFDIPEIHGSRYLRVKRLVDMIFGLASVVGLVILFPVVVVGDLIANRGPLLYRQERIGKNGRIFTIIKFRTMRAPQNGELANEWTQEDDPRITPFGNLLRKTHLDELPQALNILRGDLSIVGPRPEQPRYVEELVAKLPFYDLRHLVRPGLTGWAQVKYGYAGDERDALEKLQYEFWYLRHQSLSLDARIVGRTARSILRGRGR